MRLATAFVEIVARTESFRQQLEDARQMAASAADEIRKSFESTTNPGADRVPGHADDSPSSDRILGTPEPRTAGGSPDSFSNRSSSLAAGFDEGFPFGPALGPLVLPTGSPFEQVAAGVSAMNAAETGTEGSESTSLLRQQLELERDELDVLNKQLDALQQLQSGLPAILT